MEADRKVVSIFSSPQGAAVEAGSPDVPAGESSLLADLRRELEAVQRRAEDLGRRKAAMEGDLEDRRAMAMQLVRSSQSRSPNYAVAETFFSEPTFLPP